MCPFGPEDPGLSTLLFSLPEVKLYIYGAQGAYKNNYPAGYNVPARGGKTDIIFAACPLSWDAGARLDIKPPLNLLYLVSYVNSRGLKAELADFSSGKTPLAEAARAVAAKKPRYLGVAFYQGSQDAVFEFCGSVRRLEPEIKIIGGGPLMSARYDIILENGAVDIGVIGEGEISVYEILAAKDGGFESIDGIAFKKAGAVVLNPKTKFIENLDELPYLDYSAIDMSPYFEMQEKLKVPKSIFMTASRGCGYRCAYCASPFLWPAKVTRYSVKRLAGEIKHHIKSFPGINIGFLDDSFFSDRKWVFEFFEEMEKIRTSYSCIGRADHLDYEKIKKLSETGCRFVSMGVETGSVRKQNELKKFLNIGKVREVVKYLSEFKIYSRCFFMLGFPDETIEEMAQTINLAVDLIKTGLSDCTFFILNLYAGTELARGFEDRLWKTKLYAGVKSGRPIDLGEEKFSRYSSVPAVDINPFLNRFQLVELVKLAYQKINLREYITCAEIENLKKGGPADADMA